MRLNNIIKTSKNNLNESTIDIIVGNKLSDIVTSNKVPKHFIKLENELAVGKFEGDIYNLYTSLYSQLKKYKGNPCIVNYVDGIEFQIIEIDKSGLNIMTYDFWDNINEVGDDFETTKPISVKPDKTVKHIKMPFDFSIISQFL